MTSSLALRASAYGETTWQRLRGECGLAAQHDAVTVPSTRLARHGLPALSAKVERNEMRISIALGSVRLAVEASSALTVDEVRELGDAFFAFACQCTAAASWHDVPIDGVNFFAWRGESVPTLDAHVDVSLSRSKRAVLVALSGACTHESGVSMAGVVHRALNDANVSCSLARFVSNDDAFFPECETQDAEWCASIVHDINEAGGDVLQCDTIPLAQCRQEARIVERYGARQPPAEVVRVRPTGKDGGGVLLVLWRRVPKDEALALDVVRQVAARHPRNDLTPITVPAQVYWPTRNYFGGADDDVLYINVEDAVLGEAEFAALLARAERCKRLQVMDVSGASLTGEQLYMLLEQLKQLRLLIVCSYDAAVLEHAARHPSFDAKCAWTLDLGDVPEEFVANHHRMLTFKKQLQLQIAANEDFHDCDHDCC